jgi:tetratricopeptide (TPR) repeat protein
MLVLDNADDPRVDYQRYIPTAPSGMVMLTSRNERCKRYATEKYIALDGLSDAEARELLFRATDVPRDQRQTRTLRQDAQVVTSLLRSHPLALILAGSYVSRGHCTMAQYPGVFTQHRQRLLTFELTQAQSRYKDVYATFEASADILQSSTTESAADALQLLPVLATCAPGRLPLPLFEAGWKGAQSISPSTGDDDAIRLTPWHIAHLLPLLQTDANAWDSFRLIEAISLLKAFSLVSTDIHSGFLSVSMHPLTHAWARDRQVIPEQHESWVTTGCLVALSCADNVLWQRHGRQLQPHVQALTTWEISKMFASEPAIKITSILIKCGRLLYDMRDDAKVVVLMRSLLTHLGLDWQTVDRRWLEVYELTASNFINYGQVKKAVLLLEQVVKIREQTLAEDHPDRLASQHALAVAYKANRQVKEAVLLLEQVVKIEEQTLAEDHPDRLASQHVLATAYQANGQVREAVLLLEQVVKIGEQTLVEDHPSRLASQHVLATAYQANGQVREAVLLLEQVVKIGEQTLAEDHPYRLASQHALAIAYQENGQVKEAVSLLEQVVKIGEQTLAEDHPDQLASQHTLATVYQANGQVKEALSLLEQVVKIQEQTLAEDHPSRLASQHALAAIYWDLGHRNAALQMMKDVVEIRRQLLDEHHPDRIASEAWLEQFKREMGDMQHLS